MLQYNNMKIYQFKKGFGLLEAILAIGVMTIVITASVSLSRMAVRSSVISLGRVQSYNLAQEGLELVRQIRDNNWLNGKKWSDGLDIAGQSSYKLRFNAGNWQLVKGNEDIVLDDTLYKREIFIEKTSGSIGTTSLTDFLKNNYNIDNSKDGLMIKVTAKITWVEYGQEWTTTAVTYLSDWKPTF